MRLAKSIMLESSRLYSKIFCLIFFTSFSIASFTQDNSPYSRYGLGDRVPSSNINTRGMAGISAAYADGNSVNFNNPASYSSFLSRKESKSNKLNGGVAILDVGLNFSNRTLVAPNTPNRFTSSDLYFSYIQVGVPIKKNWGLSFGIRPVTRISYLINQFEKPAGLDSMVTQFEGSGGSFLPTLGTGFGFTLANKETSARTITNTLSLGANAGYLFGTRKNSRVRSFINNDSLLYYSSDHETNTSFGDVFFTSGLQYQIVNVNKTKKQSTVIRLGLTGNWEQTLKGTQDSLRQTFTRGSAGEKLQIDSVYQKTDVHGEIIYPASYTAGFVIQRSKSDNSGWLVGADFTTSKWSHYRFFGQQDDVGDSWQISIGGQYNPRPKTNYFSRVGYRFGVSTGSDYIKVQNKLPVLGFSYGMALPIANYNRLSYQSSVLNLSFEYNKRGNNVNLLKENVFRVSAGFNLGDLWFIKRRYE